MEYTTFGRTGLKVSVAGLGCGGFSRLGLGTGKSEADAFDPARFLPGMPPPDRFAYLPFGMGPRVCVGAQFALTEATLVLARIVRQFVIARAENRPVIPVAAITVRPDHPPPFRLTPR